MIFAFSFIYIHFASLTIFNTYRWLLKTNYRQYENLLDTMKDAELKKEIQKDWWPGEDYEIAKEAWLEQALTITASSNRNCVMQ
jgi:hypothetical protein